MNADQQVKFGMFVPQGWRMDLTRIKDPYEQYEAMTRVAREADDSGYDSIWVYDHFHTVPEPSMNTTFEAWTTTAGLSRDTKRVNIGQMVTCNAYRQPSVLAKMASTVDVMSNGRLYFGLGAGWYEHEWKAYGFPWPETPVRMGMFREACEVVHRMWTEDYPEFSGKYYTIDKPINEPKGVRKPHPMFWIGGGGERVTLKLVARWGDACNVASSDLDVFRHKLDVLRQHCEDLGRNYDEITRSTSVNIHLLEDGENPQAGTASVRGDTSLEEFSRSFTVGTAEQIAEYINGITAAGANYIIVYMPGVAYEPERVRRFSESVMPLVAAAGVTA